MIPCPMKTPERPRPRPAPFEMTLAVRRRCPIFRMRPGLVWFAYRACFLRSRGHQSAPIGGATHSSRRTSHGANHLAQSVLGGLPLFRHRSGEERRPAHASGIAMRPSRIAVQHELSGRRSVRYFQVSVRLLPRQVPQLCRSYQGGAPRRRRRASLFRRNCLAGGMRLPGRRLKNRARRVPRSVLRWNLELYA